MKKVTLGILAMLLLFGVTLLDAQERHPLTGEWEFVSGDGIYFFWWADIIVFWADGTVVVREDGDEDTGVWSVRGSNQLQVDYGSGSNKETDYFTFSIVDHILTIIDEDNDSGIWMRTK